MLYLKSFTFNPFQENTYVIYTEDKKAIIIDPGNSDNAENQELADFIASKDLVPEKLLLTHAHIDHVLGNKFINDRYGLLPEVHREDLFFIDRMMQSAAMYGVPCEQSPRPERYLEGGQTIYLGKYAFQCLHTPGHSPGSVSFYNKENSLLISGDVLFAGSVGRSDLPMGNHETLINSIRTELLVLPGETRVYPGHGPATTISAEQRSNPFLT